jgi:2-polyprenyl-6-methoxyphenol hydroxylase-like FAD-dependent oxidoreductase
MTPPIAILGAGPSGLMLGRLLHLAKIDFVIFEQDESPIAAATVASGRGGSLDIHAGSGQVAIKEAGLWDEFHSIARYDASVKIADAKGKVYVNVDEDADSNDKPEVDRKDLRALLLNSVPASSVHWGFKIQHGQKDTDGSISVHSRDGRIESGFKLVVGADGAWSKARSLVSCLHIDYYRKGSTDTEHSTGHICQTRILGSILLDDEY